MRVAVHHEPGAPLAIKPVRDLRACPGDLVIAVHRRGICGSDLHMAGVHGPDASMAREFSAEMVGTGGDTGDFRTGDRMTAMPFIAFEALTTDKTACKVFLEPRT